jgi:hypothetical protein
MEFEDLDIQQLSVGASQNGRYRGHKVHRVHAIADQPEMVLARVFLEAPGGPAAVEVDEAALERINVLDVDDGDSIIVTRIAQDDYSVAKESD